MACLNFLYSNRGAFSGNLDNFCSNNVHNCTNIRCLQTDVGYLSTVFPLIFVIISLPVGYFIDSRGFRKAILLGTGFMAVFGLLRAFSPNFIYLLIFQALAGVSQPFIMNSISKLVKGWFPEKETGLATGLGSLSLFIGMVIGLISHPYLLTCPLSTRHY